MLVGLDLGTSRFRAIGFDDSGARVATAEAAPEVRYGRNGAVSLDPDAVWAAACEVLRDVSAAAAPRALGVCAQLAVLGVGAHGQATTPIILWSDQRAAVEAAVIATSLGASGYELARRPIVAELPAAKIRAAITRAPALARRTRAWISLKDYMVLRLTEELVTDPTHASYTGLFDVAARRWSPRLAEAALVDPATLPVVREATELAGRVSPGAARLTGIPAGTPVAVGAPDGTAGAVGAGATKAGVTVDVAGSTDVVFRTVRTPGTPGDRNLIVNAFAAPGLWAVGGATGMTGGAILWLGHLLGYAGAAELREGLRARGCLRASSDGIVFRTELTGGRFPRWQPALRGAISGLRPDHDAGHLLRAAEEGAAFLVGDGLDEIERVTGRVREVVVVGGGSREPGTLELRASAWARRVRTVREPEASALGAALLAAVAAGEEPSLTAAAGRMIASGPKYSGHRSWTAALDRAKAAWRTAGEAASL